MYFYVKRIYFNSNINFCWNGDMLNKKTKLLLDWLIQSRDQGLNCRLVVSVAMDFKQQDMDHMIFF